MGESVEGADYDTGRCIDVDDEEAVLITGGFYDTVDFDQDSNILNKILNGMFDAFILKLNSSGRFIMGETFRGLYSDNGVSIATDT
ncbi:MAG: hypothetical protein IT223_03780 [Crocinitomicaceae bacterium]|nr:hypothetical protein [Crocinitomicaceae bacterium]